MPTTFPPPRSPSSSASRSSRSASASAERRRLSARARVELAGYRATTADKIAAGIPLHEIAEPSEPPIWPSEAVFGCRPWIPAYELTRGAVHDVAMANPADPAETVIVEGVCLFCGDGLGDRDRLATLGKTLVCMGCGRESGRAGAG